MKDERNQEEIEDDIEAMVLREQRKTSARDSSPNANSRATLGPVRKKKKKKRAGRMKRRGSGESIRSMRSVALPTIEESDSESILTNGSSHAGSVTIAMVYHTGRKKKEHEDVEMGDLDVSDTSDSSSSREDEEVRCQEHKSLSQKQHRMERIKKRVPEWARSRWSVAALALLILVILIAAVVGGVAGSKSSSAKASSLPATSGVAPTTAGPASPTVTTSSPLRPPSDNVEVTPPASAPIATTQEGRPSNFDSIYLNAGGEDDYVDADGRLWSPDTFDGPIYQDCDNPNVFTNTKDRPLYCRERYGSDGDDLRYSFRIPRGEYQLVLHFAEIFHQASGRRVMDIYINGDLVKEDFDIFKEAKGGFRAIQLFYTVEVMSSLSLRLEPKQGSDNAKVNAIEVHHITNARDPSEYDVINDVAVALVVDAVTAAPTVAPVVVSTNAPTSKAPVVASQQQPQQPQQSVQSSSILINAGSTKPELRIDGEVWTSDRQLPMWVSGGSVRDDCGPEAAVGCSYRFFRAGAVARYDIPVPSGEYEVLLQFAESFHEKKGDRLFHIFVQNMNLPFRRNYDVLEVAQSLGVVVTESVRTVVNNDMLTISFERVKGDPLVCGIIIMPL